MHQMTTWVKRETIQLAGQSHKEYVLGHICPNRLTWKLETENSRTPGRDSGQGKSDSSIASPQPNHLLTSRCAKACGLAPVLLLVTLHFEMSSGKAIGIQYSSFSVSCDFIWFSFFLTTDLTFLPPPHCFISHIWNGLIFTLFPAPLLSFYYKLSPVSSYFCVFFKTFKYFPILRQHFL